MKFFKYGITLERLKEEDIELVRQWRNSDPVRLNMNFREIITPEQQRKWFNSINNVNFHYVIIQYKGVKIGLLNDKNIDWENLTSETGIFVGRPEFFHSTVPYRVSVAGIETLFHTLGWKKQYAHIHWDGPPDESGLPHKSIGGVPNINGASDPYRVGLSSNLIDGVPDITLGIR